MSEIQAPPATETTVPSKKVRGRHASNRIATAVITAGGASVILVVVAIFIFIAFETIPLWIPATVHTVQAVNPLDTLSRFLFVGEDEYRTVGFGLTKTAELVSFDLKTQQILTRQKFGENETVSAVYFDQKSRLISWVNEKGDFAAYHVDLHSSAAAHQKMVAEFAEVWTQKLLGTTHPHLITAQMRETNNVAAVIIGSALHKPDVQLLLYEKRENSFTGETTSNVVVSQLNAHYDGMISGVALDHAATKAVIGTTAGKLYYWDVRNSGSPTLIHSFQASQTGVAISAIEFLLGEQTIIVGAKDGSISSWTWVNDTSSASGRKLARLNTFEPHTSAVTAISSSPRNKSFLTGDESGEVFLHYQTTASKLAGWKVGEVSVRNISFAPKADGALSVLANGRVIVDSIYNPHPEVSLSVLLGKVQYEGYAEPTYTWQSTGGTDDFEPKLSLMPLLIGTVKGAFYALIFALPIALLSAIYTALFAHPKIKNLVKPTVEIMAALPSVVVGFIAALWFAPLLEKMFVSITLMVLLIPFFILLTIIAWQMLPKSFIRKLPQGAEIFLIIPALILMMYLGMKAGSLVEASLFAGNFQQWLYTTFNVSYDQRNSVVVGFAMGFAVIPIIFTISEDSLSSVPEHLTAGSLALGATRWQTAIKVVLPTASPGIFSAAMIGFGRAVGETMIVLMATGNTPLMDLSPFLGMRTLSANIAVEIPEAPYLGTLYRVLFIAGLLLFIFTFVVNTLAEIIRQRLRKRYSTI